MEQIVLAENEDNLRVATIYDEARTVAVITYDKGDEGALFATDSFYLTYDDINKIKKAIDKGEQNED